MDNIFRDSAIQSIRSPKKNDYPVSVIKLRVWLIVVLSVIFSAVVAIWGFFGSIPITIEIPGVYTNTCGIITIYAEEDGIVEDLFKNGYEFKVEGDNLYKLKGKDPVKCNINGNVIEYIVRENQQVFRGDKICTIAETGSNTCERVYAYAPFNYSSTFNGKYYPANVDLVGLDGEVEIMSGVVTLSPSSKGSVSDEKVSKYGLKELEEELNDGIPRVEVMCIPENEGDNELDKYMAWQSEIYEKHIAETNEIQNGDDDNDMLILPDRNLSYVTVTLEYRRPITLLIPALEKIFPPVSAQQVNKADYATRVTEIDNIVNHTESSTDEDTEEEILENIGKIDEENY